MRQKDLNICSPFLVNGSETQPSFPPLVVQRFRSWSCNLCLGGNEFNIGYQSDQRTYFTGIKETLTDKSVHARNEIDINKLIDLTGDSDEEEKNDAEVSIDEITGNFKIITCVRVFCLMFKSLTRSSLFYQILILNWRMISIIKYQIMMDLHMYVQASSRKCMQIKEVSEFIQLNRMYHSHKVVSYMITTF